MCVSLRFMGALTALVLLVTSSYGLDSICDATQNAPCYGALGGAVYLQLMGNATGHELSISYGGEVIFRFRKSKPVFYNVSNTSSVRQGWQFVPDNGTLIINPAERRDSGRYSVQIFESSGATGGDHTVQLIIEAPVTKVDLSINCSAYGKRSVICSSNGDSPQFSWSLNGRSLNETSTNQRTRTETKTNLTSDRSQSTDGDSKNKTALPSPSEQSKSSHDVSTDLRSVILTVPEGTEGNLTCSARNSISNTSNTQLLPSCTTTPAPPTTPTTTSTSVSTASMTTSNVVSVTTNTTSANQTRTTQEQLWSDHIIYLGAAVAGGVLFLCVSISVFCICKKKKKKTEELDVQSQDSQPIKKTSSPPAESYELEYAEVSILTRGKSERRKRAGEAVEYGEVRRREETVEYGEVKVPGSANHAAPEGPAATNHTPLQESVYAQVCKGQR